MNAAADRPAGPTVSALVVNWNGKPHLERCLQALAPLPLEVVVVDNGSTDGSADAVAAGFPAVRLLRLDENRGFAGGVNAAARLARGAMLLVLNPDIVPADAAVGELARALDADPGAGAAGGLLVDADGQPQAGSVRRFPTLATWACDLLLVDKLWPTNPITSRYLARDIDLTGPHPIDIDQPAGACLLIRRDAFQAVGGFDERFRPAWFEDVDFCMRLRQAGWRTIVVPMARFHHIGGVAMRALGLDAFSRVWYSNLERLVAKHGGTAAVARIKTLIAAGMLLRVLWSIGRGSGADARAYAAVLRQTVTTWP